MTQSSRPTSRLAPALVRTHRLLPCVAGYVYASIFSSTRTFGNFPDEGLCPLGARKVELHGVPRVSAAYAWGGHQPSVLALHGWGADSTTMLNVVHSALTNGMSTICFDAPGHGISPGSQATLTEYSGAIIAVLQRFPSVRAVVAHSIGSIAAIAAVASDPSVNVRDILLLAPPCSMAGVLDRWASQRELPRGVVIQMSRDLRRREGRPVEHWDIRTLGLPSDVRLVILHDPTDEQVPVSDSYRIAAELSADFRETQPGTGHYGILGCQEMQTALASILRPQAGLVGAIGGGCARADRNQGVDVPGVRLDVLQGA
jgi:pimeloyl-ACP methyl ester carboxylesterase